MSNQYNKLLLPSFSLPLPCCSPPLSAHTHWNESRKWSNWENQPLHLLPISFNIDWFLSSCLSHVLFGQERVKLKTCGTTCFSSRASLKHLGEPRAKNRHWKYKGTEIQVLAVPATAIQTCLSCTHPLLHEGKGQDDTALCLRDFSSSPLRQKSNCCKQSSRTPSPSQQTWTARDHRSDVLGRGKTSPHSSSRLSFRWFLFQNCP